MASHVALHVLSRGSSCTRSARAAAHARHAWQRSSAHALSAHSRRTRHRARVYSGEDAQRQAATVAPDHYVAAAARVQKLLSVVGDGEDELMDMMLTEEGAGAKISIYLASAGCITLVAYFVCWLCDKDPWGGASLSLSSVLSGLVGGVLGAPLVAFRWWAWTDRSALTRLPGLADLLQAKLEDCRPWLAGLSRLQVGAVLTLERVPMLMLMLPAATGCLGAWLSELNKLGEGTSGAVSLFAVAGLVAALAAARFDVDDEQLDTLRAAVGAADKYYRVTSPGSAQEAAAAALAFKAVACAWLSVRLQAGSLAAWLALLQVLWLGLVWQVTDDLTAAAVAALAADAVDYHFMHTFATGGGNGGGHSGLPPQQQRSS